jgi:hypothetical protein
MAMLFPILLSSFKSMNAPYAPSAIVGKSPVWGWTQVAAWLVDRGALDRGGVQSAWHPAGHEVIGHPELWRRFSSVPPQL